MKTRRLGNLSAVRLLIPIAACALLFATGCGKAPIRVGGKVATALEIDAPYWTRVGDDAARRPGSATAPLQSAQVRLQAKGKKHERMSPGIGTTSTDGEFNVQIPLSLLDSVEQVRLVFRLDGYKPQFIDFSVSDLRKAEILCDGRKHYVECWLPPTEPE